jgi:hypothetical protein
MDYEHFKVELAKSWLSNDAARRGAVIPATVSWRVEPKAAVRPTPDLSTTPDYLLHIHTMASPPPVEDQARLLEDALAVVRQQTLLMRRCLETPGKLMDALKCRCARHTRL